VAEQKLRRGARIIRRGDDVSRGSNNHVDDECCSSSCERSVGKAKNDRSFSPSSFSWWNDNDDEDDNEDNNDNDFRGTNGGGDNNEKDEDGRDDDDGDKNDDGDNEDKDDLRFLVGDAKDDDGNKVEEFGEWLLIIMISSSLSTTSCTRPSWCVWKSSR